MWRMGMYVMSAVTVAVDRCLGGKKSKAEYIEKPLLDELDVTIDKREQNRELTEEEKQRLIDEFVLKRKLEKANWDLRNEGR